MPKLLIVDDETDVREFVKCFFAKRDIDVSVAGGGEEALRMISLEKPDLVLLDVRMEALSGVDVLKELRSKKDSTKVIMVTGVEDEEVVNEAKKWGVKDYIHKPLVLEELERVVMAELKR
jgi:DNA-binding response OmpR family regulator